MWGISPLWSSPRERCCQRCHCWSPWAWVSVWSLCLSQCRAVTWSTVTPLNVFPKMLAFSLDFVDVWGSLERMKRNFSLSDFDTYPNRCFQLYFCHFFWEAHLSEKSGPMRGEPFQDLPGMLKVPVYQERFGRGRYGDSSFPLCSLIHSSSSLIPAGCARLVAAGANNCGERAVWPWN